METTTLGPLNNGSVAAKMDEHVGDAIARGASVVCGGSRARAYAVTGDYMQADPSCAYVPSALAAAR